MAATLGAGDRDAGDVGCSAAPASELGAPARRKRRSYEAGHNPKILVLVDHSLECERAVYYASRRAARVGAKVVLLRVIDPGYREHAWLGVGEIMQAEAQQEARDLLNEYVACAEGLLEITPETAIREGNVAEEMFQLIRHDEDIAIMVLAAGSTPEGPGPLVTDLARTAGTYPVPVVIVPAHLSNEELDALA